MNIIKRLEEDLNLDGKRIEAAIKLIDEGNTIPFIARYRKEKTGSMSDETLRNFYEKYTYLVNFYDRLNTISNSITEQGKMTDEKTYYRTATCYRYALRDVHRLLQRRRYE